jgi:hypothetical protein
LLTASEKHLQLLFSILEGGDEASLRANIIIAIGDITKRFPNVIKPWTGYLYRRLRDPDSRVRKNTLYADDRFHFHSFFSFVSSSSYFLMLVSYSFVTDA